MVILGSLCNLPEAAAVAVIRRPHPDTLIMRAARQPRKASMLLRIFYEAMG
jgi:hypothetical protein